MKQYLVIILSFLSLSAVSLLAQSQCTDDPPMSLPQLISGPDTTEHQTKSHWSATGSATPDSNGNPIRNPTSDAITGTCGYTHGTNPNCTTTCTVDFSGTASDSELGILGASGSHVVNHGSQNGTATATGAGASCTGFFGAGTANCFGVIFGVCTPAVSVSAGGVTISTAGTVVWKSSPNPASLSCAAKPDPQNQVSSIGGRWR